LAIQQLRSAKLCLRYGKGLLRVERFFRGMVRDEEVFEHVMDNLYALEDPQIIDEHTIIGTATLPDWIMGGQLTSRMWVRDQGSTVLALRPLYHDNVEDNVDRRYELVEGRDDRRIATMRSALRKIRFLASIKHTVTSLEQEGHEPTGSCEE